MWMIVEVQNVDEVVKVHFEFHHFSIICATRNNIKRFGAPTTRFLIKSSVLGDPVVTTLIVQRTGQVQCVLVDL